MSNINFQRRLPIGAELLNQGHHFRVWAPKCAELDLVLLAADGREEIRQARMDREEHGYFSCLHDPGAHSLYGFRMDGGSRWFPDPASRFQPFGPEGPSQIVDPLQFEWTDADWPGLTPRGQVLYEMHVGTFTPEGTWAAAMRELEELARLGITIIEVMPIADFAGEFGWGYDGVNLFAPTRNYGCPDDFRAFVNRAHALGLGVILDVVYNHLGPVGNYLPQYSDHYFTDRHVTEWGAAINFDDADSGEVRKFFRANVRYWIEEFHVDGYRFDATQAIVDASPRHILSELSAEARAAAGKRTIHLSVENQPQDVINIRPIEAGGYGMDAIWNDDFHHAARVRATGRTDGYYQDFTGEAYEFVAAFRHGFLYQGQHRVKGTQRGTSTRGLPPHVFISFLENHDQVSNSAYGRRLHQLTSPARYRALAGVWLLSPQTPMFWQGQEYGASAPFVYFADLDEELGRMVWEGRKSFLSQFPSLATADMQSVLPNPCDRRVFERCKLPPRKRGDHVAMYRLHVDLLELRKSDPVLACPDETELDGVAFNGAALALRYYTSDGADRLILANFGRTLTLSPASHPILATLPHRRWELTWSSEHPRYEGDGIAAWQTETGWRLTGNATILLRAVE